MIALSATASPRTMCPILREDHSAPIAARPAATDMNSRFQALQIHSGRSTSRSQLELQL